MSDLPPLKKIYRGSSMRRVFRDGEMIYLERIDFLRVRRGDVLVFKRGDGVWIIHRAVKKTGKEIITRGDNCTSCDSEPLTSRHELFRAIYVGGLNGVVRPVYNGWFGCWHSFGNRLRRRGRVIFGGVVNSLLPFMWWRRTLKEPVMVGAVAHFMAGGKLVAVRSRGEVKYKKAINKIFYKLPSEEPDDLPVGRRKQIVENNYTEMDADDEAGEIQNNKE